MVNQVFMQGLLAALAAGLVTGIGGFMIFLKKRYLKTEINQLLNLAAGVMLAASFFSLLVPSMHEIVRDSRNIYSGALGYVLTVFAGVLLVWILNLLIPHEHNSMGHHGPHFDLKKAWLFILPLRCTNCRKAWPSALLTVRRILSVRCLWWWGLPRIIFPKG